MNRETITTEDNNTIHLVKVKDDPMAHWVTLDGHIIGNVSAIVRFGDWSWSLNTSKVDPTSTQGLFKNHISAAKKVYSEHMKQNKNEYKANFLFGFEDDSVEALGYEFANAKTEEYQKECWNALVEKIKESDQNTLAFDKRSAKALYDIFSGLSRSCYENAEVYEEAKSAMREVYDKVLEWGKNENQMI